MSALRSDCCAVVDVAASYLFATGAKAGTAISKGKEDSAARHLNDTLNDFGAALDHAAKAEDDAYKDAGKELDKGNSELNKSIKAFADGRPDIGQSHYDSAVESYDKALDLIG